MSESLFERLGGQNAVNAAVDIFYRKMLTDERVSHFFDDVDMEQQILKQKGFLTMVFGGPNKYNGKNMREGHAHLLKRGLMIRMWTLLLSISAQHLQSWEQQRRILIKWPQLPIAFEMTYWGAHEYRII